MSLHSYSQCWLHFIWATWKREPMITTDFAPKLSAYLTKYAATKRIFIKCNFVNPEHVHALINLPTNQTIEGIANLLKGGSSRWIGQQKILEGHFYWGRGYGVFSVSQSDVPRVCKYIANQEEHHRKRNFSDEFRLFIEKHGLRWYGPEDD
jgi:putative transposase